MRLIEGCRRLASSIVATRALRERGSVVSDVRLVPLRNPYDVALRPRPFTTNVRSWPRTVTKRDFSAGSAIGSAGGLQGGGLEMHTGDRGPPGGLQGGGLEMHTGDSGEGETLESQRFDNGFTIDVMVSVLRQENAVDICVIKVPEEIKYAEYFVIVSGISPRHLRAMAHYVIKVYKFMKKDGDPNVKIEGKDGEDWMCIDFGSMVVHFMLPETREVYELEKLWTLRSYDEQLRSIPAETLPEDFIYGVEVTK